MNDLKIQRESILKPVLEIIQDCIIKNQSGIIELHGDAGCGKTTVLNQIEKYFSYYGIYPQINIAIGYQNFTVQSYLKSVVNRKIKFEINSGIDLIPQLNELLLSSTNYQKDIQVFIIDDSHLLSEEIIEQLKLLFNKYYGFNGFFLILSGRNNLLNNLSIEIRSYSDKEFYSIICSYLNEEWVENNSDIYKWIMTLTEAWPFYLTIFLQWGIKLGLLSTTTQKPLEQIKAKKLPKNLLTVVKQRYNFNLISELQKEILTYISFIPKNLSNQDIASILSRSLENITSAIQHLVSDGWIDNENNLFHPLIGQMIIDRTKNKNQINQNILNSNIELSIQEKAIHILQLKKLTENHKSVLLKYINEIEIEGLFYSAIKALEKIDPNKQDNQIQFKIAINLYKIGKNNESKTIFQKLLKIKSYQTNHLVYYYLGNIYYYQKKLEKSIEIINQGIGLIDERLSIRKLQLLLTKVYAKCGTKEQILDLLSHLEPRKSMADNEKLDYYSLVSSIHYKTSLEIDLIKNNEKGIKVAKKLNNNTALADLYLGLSEHLEMAEKIEDAIKNCNKALEYSKMIFNFKLINAVIQQRGQIYIRSGRMGSGN